MGPGSQAAVLGNKALAKKYRLDLSDPDGKYGALVSASKVPDHSYLDAVQFLAKAISAKDNSKTFTLESYMCHYSNTMGLKHPVELAMAYRNEKLTKLLIDRGRKKKERAIRVANRLMQNDYDKIFQEKVEAEIEQGFQDVEVIVQHLEELTAGLVSTGHAKSKGNALECAYCLYGECRLFAFDFSVSRAFLSTRFLGDARYSPSGTDDRARAVSLVVRPTLYPYARAMHCPVLA
eukprot:3164511-Rhodomonas_salina.3